jgi:hypothetical protein
MSHLKLAVASSGSSLIRAAANTTKRSLARAAMASRSRMVKERIG